jgi:hypothetical protein
MKSSILEMLQTFMQFLKVFMCPEFEYKHIKTIGKYIEKKVKAILKCNNTKQKQICM